MRLFATGYGRLSPLIRYFHADDPEGAARNTIAACVVGNIPFYPLYAWLIAGGRGWPAALALLTLPLFALVPWAGRRAPRGGRWLLLAAGLLDTFLCAKGLGAATGVELYYVSIALLPLLMYREESLTVRATMVCAVAAAFGAGRLIEGPFAVYSPAELRGFVSMHAISVTLLSGVIVVLWWRERRAFRAF